MLHTDGVSRTCERANGRTVARAKSLVVPLVLLGTITTLAIAIVATHRSRYWWLPGVAAMGMGIFEATLPIPKPIAEGSMVLGACAVVIARLIRAAVPSRT